MRRNIIFAGDPGKWNFGSSHLRSRQLGQLAAASVKFNGLEVEFASDLSGHNSIQILNKYAIEHFSTEELAESKKRNNRLIADPLDGVFENPHLELFDGVIAASLLQRDYYLSSLCIPVAYVGHHVDQRISFLPQPPSRSAFSIAYFGEITNARFTEALYGRVIFHSVDTTRAESTDWMARLNDYPAHYAIRAPITEKLFKPFTKGFIAAHCLAPVLIDEVDEEARRFLHDTYPYFTRTESPEDIRTTIDRMAADFEAKSPDWISALESMRRVRAQSDPRLIVSQLYAAISPLL